MGTKINISEIALSTEANVLTSMVWENTSDPNAKGSHLGAKLGDMLGFNLDGFQKEVTEETKNRGELYFQ